MESIDGGDVGTPTRPSDLGSISPVGPGIPGRLVEVQPPRVSRPHTYADVMIASPEPDPPFPSSSYNLQPVLTPNLRPDVVNLPVSPDAGAGAGAGAPLMVRPRSNLEDDSYGAPLRDGRDGGMAKNLASLGRNLLQDVNGAMGGGAPATIPLTFPDHPPSSQLGGGVGASQHRTMHPLPHPPTKPLDVRSPGSGVRTFDPLDRRDLNPLDSGRCAPAPASALTTNRAPAAALPADCTTLHKLPTTDR
jgi:hypothetical protein